MTRGLVWQGTGGFLLAGFLFSSLALADDWHQFEGGAIAHKNAQVATILGDGAYCPPGVCADSSHFIGGSITFQGHSTIGRWVCQITRHGSNTLTCGTGSIPAALRGDTNHYFSEYDPEPECEIEEGTNQNMWIQETLPNFLNPPSSVCRSNCILHRNIGTNPPCNSTCQYTDVNGNGTADDGDTYSCQCVYTSTGNVCTGVEGTGYPESPEGGAGGGGPIDNSDPGSETGCGPNGCTGEPTLPPSPGPGSPGVPGGPGGEIPMEGDDNGNGICEAGEACAGDDGIANLLQNILEGIIGDGTDTGVGAGDAIGSGTQQGNDMMRGEAGKDEASGVKGATSSAMNEAAESVGDFFVAGSCPVADATLSNGWNMVIDTSEVGAGLRAIATLVMWFFVVVFSWVTAYKAVAGA